ncbi:hypothetical protein WOLCODRAFT_103392 [Wolfiporia cocos MD-104 SS10]|uniref:Uncharacterized protein n=1 Tax=Wolfiporia cocos (strain MD-104) TaxID=742152 RepID=A0A2H3JMA1_WOLCO|nr:hypothetical protein WOLCODRAFT_103392 [Wolfiporia cocos MD-104 SS10]
MLLAAMKAWQEEYSGDSHELLLNEINRMNSKRLSIPERNSYANHLPIIQSSGTGKSRMVDEMAKLIFTIPFCIRDPHDESNIQFPQADKEVAEFLLRNSNARYQDVKLLYLIFFEHLFVRVQEIIEQDFPIDRYTDESDLARAWWEYLLTERTSLYTTVIERIDVPITNRAIERQTRDTVAKGSSLLKQLEKFTRRQTEDGSDDKKDQTSVKLVLYFDEAHTLGNSCTWDSGLRSSGSRYNALQSALNQIGKLSLFAVTISTLCSIAPVPTSRVMSPSARLGSLEIDTLQAQYTELPFDCLLDRKPLIATGQCSLEDTCELSFICRFGRPLWMALYKHGNDEVRETMVDLAMDKLTGIRGFNDSAPSLKVLTDARLAILATRLLLDFNTREKEVQMEALMVASQMRIAYSIPAHNYYLRSGYPSEPILAEAAARAMAEFRQPTATILASYAESGLIDIGNRGELVMRLLLLQAFDAAVKKECSADKSPSFNRPVRLFDFLEALLGSENLEKIKKKVPGNTASSTKTFEEAFTNAQVHFTHFARNEDMSVSNSYGAWAALARGMAMQCSRNQDGIDCIVPVLLNSNDKLCEEAVTGLLIQCKKEQSDPPVRIKEEATGDGKGFFPQDKKDERPYIGLIMELGCEPEGGTDACENPPRDSARETIQNAHHPCYLINIKGCSPVEYPVIEQEAVNSYAVLLGHQGALSARRDLFSEHARQSAASLKAVQRLKPTWTTKREGCYDWLKDPRFGRIIDEDRGCGAAKGSQQEPEGTFGRRISNGESQQ